MIGPWIAPAIYIAGFVVTARLAARYFAGDDGAEARFNATILGLIWPAALVIFCVVALLALPTLGVKTARDRQRKTETAEWEAGIGP